MPSTRLSEYPGGGPLPRPYYDIYDPFLALNTAAAATTSLKIGTGICLVVQRDPIVTAKMVSSIDQLSKGGSCLVSATAGTVTRSKTTAPTFATRHKLARERIEAMQTIWTQDEPAYRRRIRQVRSDEPMAEAVPEAASADHRRWRVSRMPRSRAIRYGNGWIPRADRLEHDGVGVVIKKFRDMATEAGRDPASLPISIFRVPDDLTKLRFCQEIGVDRVVFSLPAEKEDKILPILDRWVEVKRDLGSVDRREA